MKGAESSLTRDRWPVSCPFSIFGVFDSALAFTSPGLRPQEE